MLSYLRTAPNTQQAMTYTLVVRTMTLLWNVIKPQGTMKIHTGLAMEIPKGYFGAIFARSGMATKRGLRPANCVGVIDSDYRGEIIVALRNDSDSEQVITSGERIAQIVIMPYLPIEFNEVNSLEDTERGDGGFGSTGVN